MEQEITTIHRQLTKDKSTVKKSFCSFSFNSLHSLTHKFIHSMEHGGARQDVHLIFLIFA